MNFLLIPVAAPVLVTPLLFILPAGWRRRLMLLYSVSLFAVALYIVSGAGVLNETLLNSEFLARSGLTFLTFKLHPYGKIAAFGFTLVGSLGLLYGLKQSNAAEQAVSIWAIAAAIGVSFANNYLTFLLFWELLSLAAAALVYLKKTAEAVKMATRLLIFQLVGGFSVTVGIVLQYFATGSFDLVIPEAGLLFFIIGIGIKTAFIPLHLWVPWGYPAASFPSSVLLAALCTKAGVYGVARILPPGEGIALMGACMALVGVAFALMQSRLRSLLSYHIISQVGYMVAGVGLGVACSVDGGLLHLVNHMIYKALLFMSAGAVLLSTGSENIHELHHPEPGEEGPPLWRVIPIAAAGAVIGALSIAGMPPFNGYVSKFLLKNGTHDFPLIFWVLQIASVGTALSFAKFVYFGFIKGRLKLKQTLDVPMQAAIIGLSACCILFGIFPGLLKAILPYQSSLQVYTAAGVLMAAGLVGGGILLFAIFSRQLGKESRAPEELVDAGRKFNGALKSAAATLWAASFSLGAAILQYCRSLFGATFRSAFRLGQRLDYKPGGSGLFMTVNFSNIDFDITLIMIILGTILVVLFSIQFGFHSFAG